MDGIDLAIMLEGRVDEAMMIAMNARAELQGVAFDVIARDQLATLAHAPTAASTATKAKTEKDVDHRGFWAKLFAPDLTRLAMQHLFLVAAAVTLATLLGVPIAVLTISQPRLSAAVLGTTGLLQTVPAIAMLAVLISLLGAIGTLPALIARPPSSPKRLKARPLKCKRKSPGPKPHISRPRVM